MFEASKALSRRMHDVRFATRFFVGSGLDIGCGEDNVSQFRFVFTRMTECRGWDLSDGDALTLTSIGDDHVDFVHSSHCLEHVTDPFVALQNWARVLKPGGHLIVIVPDEDMYEQGVFPSTFNPDHKWTFTVDKVSSWSAKSVSLLRLLSQFSDTMELIKIEQLDFGFRYDADRRDQTLTPYSECAIEFIMRKRLPTEITRKGRIPSAMA